MGLAFMKVSAKGCDLFTMLNDFGLCEECAGKLERDLLRQRDWDFTLTLLYSQ